MPSVAARGVPCAAADIAVIDFIVIDTPHRNFDRASRDMIYKSPIVTDHYDRLPVIDQKIFQPLDGLNIEVVGRSSSKSTSGFFSNNFANSIRIRQPPLNSLV